ncbi:MAG: hypothetical protein HQM10_00145 [Candidatus Riflebacteria bacterium]|nr:hypothetical protein [Candidatus Riflebacteria bacterium]
MKKDQFLCFLFLLFSVLLSGQVSADETRSAYEQYLAVQRKYSDAVTGNASEDKLRNILGELQTARCEYYRLIGKTLPSTEKNALVAPSEEVNAPAFLPDASAESQVTTQAQSSQASESAFLADAIPGLYGQNRASDSERLIDNLSQLLQTESDPARQIAIHQEIAVLMVEGKGDYSRAIAYLQKVSSSISDQKLKLVIIETLYQLKRDQKIAAQMAVVTQKDSARQEDLARFTSTSWLNFPGKIGSMAGYCWNTLTGWFAKDKLKRLQKEEKDLQKGDFRRWLVLSPGEHYQQSEFQLIDPIGDAFLIKKIDQMPLKVVQMLLGGTYPQADANEERQTDGVDENGNKIPFEIGKTVPIDVERLINKMRDIIRRNPEISPFIGEEHKWSPEASSQMMSSYMSRVGRVFGGRDTGIPVPIMFQSRLFLLLACGFTSRYAITGTEKELEAKLMTYPDRGVQIHDMFRESYLLNKGNMYLTLLAAENILAGNPYRKTRDDSPLQKKLAYFRQDSLPRGDNYGAWYHFFGIGLYGMLRPGVVSRAVAEIESLGSIFFEGFDRQEDYVNRYGSIWGKKIEEMIRKKTYLVPLKSNERTDYMLNDPALQQTK